MKTGKNDDKKVKVMVDPNLKKYSGKNLSKKKKDAFTENLEQIKNAITKYYNPVTQ